MVAKEKGCKINAVRAGDSDSSKIILILLTEFITLYVKLTTIYI